MKREAERLAAAQAQFRGEWHQARAEMPAFLDAKEAAWASVFAAGKSTAAEAEERGKRKYARKAEKRKEKMAAQDANAANLTLYVTGIPKDVSWTRCSRSLRAGEVRRVKLYKDESGEQKGDGVVTFASEDEKVNAAVGRDWDLFGETLKVERARRSKPSRRACQS